MLINNDLAKFLLDDFLLMFSTLGNWKPMHLRNPSFFFFFYNFLLLPNQNVLFKEVTCENQSYFSWQGRKTACLYLVMCSMSHDEGPLLYSFGSTKKRSNKRVEKKKKQRHDSCTSLGVLFLIAEAFLKEETKQKRRRERNLRVFLCALSWGDSSPNFWSLTSNYT